MLRQPSIGSVVRFWPDTPGKELAIVLAHLPEDYVLLVPLGKNAKNSDPWCLEVTVDDMQPGLFPGWVGLDQPWSHVASSVAVEAQLTAQKTSALLRQHAVLAAKSYAQHHFQPVAFTPNVSPVPPSGKWIGENEIALMTEAVLDGWLTTGRFNRQFELSLAAFLQVNHVLTTNSGSSANLLAVAALTSPLLQERALRPGDEVITVGAGFPTTVNPLLQYGLVPVFVDAHIPTYNIDPQWVEAAVSDKTRAIILAHTLGNPFDLQTIVAIAKKYNLWLIEDCCDALGSTYQNQLVGTFGDIGTLSFYPAHHITMGEGGAVFTQDRLLKKILESFRDWGRDCYCPPGWDNTCERRFSWQLGDLPAGYDHKYVYSHVGYNLKITDMQAAIGVAQLERLPHFIALRRHNFAYLRQQLLSLEPFLILPEATPGSDPSWFGFPLTLRDADAAVRLRLLRFLEEKKVGTRLLFAGNFIRQPYFKGQKYRVSGSLTQCDRIMNHTFWVGLHPALTEPMLDFTCHCLKDFFNR